jgi:hypothetical protein
MAHARDAAFALERALFDRGHVASVVEAATGAGALDAAEACARAGVLALLPIADASAAVAVTVEVEDERIASGEPAEPETLVARTIAALEERGHLRG